MKKNIRNTAIVSLICVGIFGALIVKNFQPTDIAIAIDDTEIVTAMDATETEVTETETTETETTEGQTSNSDLITSTEVTQSLLPVDGEAVGEVTTSETAQGSDEENNEQDEQITSEEVVANDATQHIDINMEEIIALIGEDVYNFDSEKISRVNDPSNLYVLVNKKNDLPPDYVPSDLTVPDVTFSFSGDNPKKQMRAVAADALEQLFKGALDQGLNIYAVSGYRSYSKQETIYNGNVSSMGAVEANKVSAIPGQSEHQTGLAMDVSCKSSGFDLVTSFGETQEGQWLAAHAHEYGFIIRYPKGKTDITQYSYEPWHVRYVGVTLATELFENDITLDQFYEQLMI